MTDPVLPVFPTIRDPPAPIAPAKVNVLVLLAATVPPLEGLRPKGLETVMLAVDNSAPPDKVTVPVGLFKLDGSEMERVPALMVVPPA